MCWLNTDIFKHKLWISWHGLIKAKKINTSIFNYKKTNGSICAYNLADIGSSPNRAHHQCFDFFEIELILPMPCFSIHRVCCHLANLFFQKINTLATTPAWYISFSISAHEQNPGLSEHGNREAFWCLSRWVLHTVSWPNDILPNDSLPMHDIWEIWPMQHFVLYCQPFTAFTVIF